MPKKWNDLIVIDLLTIVLILIILFIPSSIIRAFLGFPFILLFPGYALTVALFPRRDELQGVVRLVISFGLSIALVGLISLVLNSTSWGIRLESILYSMSASIFIFSIVALSRQRRLLAEERFGNRALKISFSWGKNSFEKTLSIVLIVAILGTLGTMSYAIFTPKTGQTFTEFYILGTNGTADYPKDLIVGHEAEVLLGIVNHEAVTTNYSVEIMIAGNIVNEVSSITLDAEEKWEDEVSFVPNEPGAEQKVEFILYKNGDPKPSIEPLRLWIDVTQ